MSAASRQMREDQTIECGTAAVIALINPLQQEALTEAFSRGGTAVLAHSFFGNTKAINMDCNADGKNELNLTFDRTFWGNLENIKIDRGSAANDGTAAVNRSYGLVNGMKVDSDGDGKDDYSISVKRGLGSRSLDVDTNKDGKADLRVTQDIGIYAGLKGLHVDLNADGTNDGYLKFDRNFWGDVKGFKFQRKPE